MGVQPLGVLHVCVLAAASRVLQHKVSANSPSMQESQKAHL